MKINTGRLILFSLAFMAFAVIGTISHEFGHIAVARALGYETVLHYGSMNWGHFGGLEKSKHFRELERTVTDLLDKNEITPPTVKPRNHVLMVAMGGPAQTILTGMLGLLLIRNRRRTKRKTTFKFMDWLAVFLALFWLREVFNLMMTYAKGFIQGKAAYFNGNGDEIRISNMLHLPPYLVPVVMGVIGFIICAYVVFNVVPKKQQPTFILGGVIGGAIGFYGWMYVVGPMLLP
jgi:hypothetical protein